ATNGEGEGEPSLVRASHARPHGHRGRRDRLELHAWRSGEQHGPDGWARDHRGRVLRRHVLEVIGARIGAERLPRAFTTRSCVVDNPVDDRLAHVWKTILPWGQGSVTRRTTCIFSPQ